MINGCSSSDQQPEPSKNESRDILLDYFPLNASELEQLLDIYQNWYLVCEEEHSNDSEQLLLLPFDSSWLPELASMIRKAMDRVFVVNVPSTTSSQDDVFSSGNSIWNPQLLSFLEACVSLCGRRGGCRFLSDSLFFTAAVDTEIETASMSQICSLLFRLCILCTWTGNSEADVLPVYDGPSKAWSDFFSLKTSKEPSVTLMEWKHWVDRHVPMAPYALSTLLSSLFLSPQSLFVSKLRNQKVVLHASNGDSADVSPSKYPSFQLPNVVGSSMDVPSWMSAAISGGTATALSHSIPIQLTIVGLGGIWHPIYLSYNDGFSFPLFCDKLVRYCGPTLILVESTKHEFFGYYTTIPWKISSRWYSANKTDQTNGSSQMADSTDEVSFLFRLHPSWNVYRPQLDGIVPKRYHQFLNLPTAQKSMFHGQSNNQQTLSGLAVGGVADNVPRFHIMPSFEQCKACAWDSVFEEGTLLASEDESFFDVLNIEAWAVNIATADNYVSGDDAYQHFKEMGEIRSSLNDYVRHRCAKVDRTQFVDDFVNGSYENTLFHHRSLARGRADFVALDNERHGYFVDGKEPSTRNLPLSPSRDEDTVMD